ncbi:MAG: four helix bundle protein [Bacteroidales bacterium]|nr:four helix bundle protein [Bacteroidales bacterium]
MRGDDLVKRTMTFASDCVRFTETLPDSVLTKHVKGQLIRCSTSVAANYRATRLAQTGAAFIAKMSIVVEESDECEFWLEFLALHDIGKNSERVALLKEAHELTSIFVASRRTAQKNRTNK